jgi:hypothetical protein
MTTALPRNNNEYDNDNNNNNNKCYSNPQINQTEIKHMKAIIASVSTEGPQN